MAIKQPIITVCSVEGCGRPDLSNGLCSAHYQRQRTADRLHLINHPLPQVCEAAECDLKPRARVMGRALCNKHGLRLRRRGTLNLPGPLSAADWNKCSVGGCGRKARTSGGALCEAHYYRLRRTGTTATRQPAPHRLTADGYMARRCVGHPAASKTGHLYQHREVLFASIGHGVHQCFWCKADIEWGGQGRRRLVVDHLDGNKANNELGNLKAACHRCNFTRGSFQAWVMLHRDDPFLWRLYQQARAT